MANDRLFFRQENPNRNASLTIPATDVINHGELPVGVAEEFMYSGWDIAWMKSHADGNEGRIVGNNIRYPTAPILNGADATTRYGRRLFDSSMPATIGITLIRRNTNINNATVIRIANYWVEPRPENIRFAGTGLEFRFAAGAAESSAVILTDIADNVLLHPPRMINSVIGTGTGWGLSHSWVSISNENADISAAMLREFTPTEGWAEIFDTSAVQQRVRIIRDLINTFRHRAHGVKVPMTRAYLELQIYDVVRYLPKPLEGAHFGPLEWMVYQKKINIEKETITLDLVQRARSLNWNGGNE